MADELKLSIRMAYSKGGRMADTEHLPVDGLEIDVAGTDYVCGTQTIGTSVEALNIGDITTPGYIVITNRDATNFVSLRNGSAGANVVKLKPGDAAAFRLATDTPYAIADSAPCEITYLIIED